MARQKQDEYFKQLASKVDVLTTHSKMLEVQTTQKASFSSMLLDRLTGKLEPNPRERCNAMILGGGKQLKGPKWVTHNVSLYDKNDDIVNVEESIPSKEVIDDVLHKFDEVPKDPKITSPKPYTPPLPFP